MVNGQPQNLQVWIITLHMTSWSNLLLFHVTVHNKYTIFCSYITLATCIYHKTHRGEGGGGGGGGEGWVPRML